MKIPTSDLTESVSITRKLGEGAYGPVYADTVEVNCALDLGFRKIINEKGEVVVASGIACFRDDTNIQIGDQLDHENRKYVVLEVQPIKDGKHTHHIEVAIQSSA